MRNFKGYKGVAIIYLVITIINVIWICSYSKPNEENHVSNEKTIVYNS